MAAILSRGDDLSRVTKIVLPSPTDVIFTLFSQVLFEDTELLPWDYLQ